MKRKDRDGNDDEKSRSPSKVDPIPLDLQLEILTRLPAKSLMRFRCVSKTWSYMVRSRRFVDSFYAVSSATRSSRLVIAFSNGAFARGDDRRLFIFSSEDSSSSSSSSLVANLDMAIPSVGLSPASNCVSVHGLIGCTKSGPLIVCNPSTKKVAVFPCAKPKPCTSFGYDPVGGQFKAMTIVSLLHRSPTSIVHLVLTLGRGRGRSPNKVTTPPYFPVTKDICINGFVYYGARTPTQSDNPVVVCFDVRYERMSFIKAPLDVVGWGGESILIEYKGKLASIVKHPHAPFHSFDLWILEDVEKHEWSKQTFNLPSSLGYYGTEMTSPGTNKAGEIIFALKKLPHDVQPFYIFYYNVERKDMRRVRLLGIADSEEFRRRYNLTSECWVCISPQHIESVASL